VNALAAAQVTGCGAHSGPSRRRATISATDEGTPLRVVNSDTARLSSMVTVQLQLHSSTFLTSLHRATTSIGQKKEGAEQYE
jgi:hypothetical protein